MAKAVSWVTREGTAADAPDLRKLFELAFGFDRGAAYDAWKFRDNPDGPPIIAVAEDQGKIVGQYALWPTTLRLGPHIIRGAQSLDTMTHPDYRGQGMFTVLAEQCMRFAVARGIEVLYGFPNESSYPGFVRKLDWDCTGTIPVWTRFLRPSRHQRLPRWMGPFADVGAKILPRGSRAGFRVETGLPPAALLQQMLENWRKREGRCRIERTAERYAWRFSQVSGLNYQWICAYRGTDLLSVAVWGTDLRNGNALLAEVLGDDEKAIEAVISESVRQALQFGAPIMLVVGNDRLTNRALKRAGFFRTAQLPLIVRKLTARSIGVNVHTHECWDIFGADVDTF
jgi:GNAT superfamily N-acetyltransferase